MGIGQSSQPNASWAVLLVTVSTQCDEIIVSIGCLSGIQQFCSVELGQRPHPGGYPVWTVGQVRIPASDRLSLISEASGDCKYGRRGLLILCGTPNPLTPQCPFHNKGTFPVCTWLVRGPTWEVHRLYEASPSIPV